MTPNALSRDHEFAQNGEQYKVYRLLEPLLEAARKEQKAGYSVDVRIYARRKPSGELWGEVAFLGRDGRIISLSSNTAVDANPLAEPRHVEQYLSSIVARLFDATEGRGRSTD